MGNVEFTDNAQVKQLIVPVNIRVQGYVKRVYFNEYQHVKKGDTLLIIDDIEYRHRLAQAQADYQNALVGKKAMGTTIQSTISSLDASDAGIEECRVRLENASREYTRYQNLYAQQSVTKQQFDDISTLYMSAKARYEQAVHQRNSSKLIKNEQTLRLDQNNAQIELVRAALELSKLNLSYTVVTAPCDGFTGRKNIQEGQLLQPGQLVLDLVKENEIWVMANYKETQTLKMAEGQNVNIEVDAMPGIVFKGVVNSISKATGASFSMFPQDNSSGNFIKVQQRIPVRIEFTRDNKLEDLNRLRAGMNVECEVKL